VSVEATPPVIDKLRRLPDIAGVSPVRVYESEAHAPAGIPPSRTSQEFALPVSTSSVAPASNFDYGFALPGIRQLAIDEVHRLGFTGQGVRIAVLDAGFDLTHEAVASLNVVEAWNFIHGDSVVSDRPGEPPGGAEHGTRTLSIIAANLSGTLVGPAPEAEFLLAKVERRQVQKSVVDEDRWVAALQWADSLGARIVHSSLTYRRFSDRSPYAFSELNGQTAVSSVAAAQAAMRGLIVITPIGDEAQPGAGSLHAPADAMGVIAVGATAASGLVAPFSARGPTGDGRIKPDLAAPGASVTGASLSQPTGYQAGSGTDRAAALVTGAVALMAQAWPGLSPQEVLAALAGSATFASSPNPAVGHGVPNLAAALAFPDGIRPAPVSGAEPSGTLHSLAPGFTWDVPRVHPVVGAVTYRLEVATDAEFRNVIVSDTVGELTSAVLRQPLRPTPTLWWRVIAETDSGIHRTTPALGPLFMPRWVELTALSSASNQFTTATRPRLTWRAVQAPPPVGPLTYTVQILSAENGSVLQSMEGIRDTTITVVQQLEYNRAYRWRVIARTPGGVADTVESAAPFVVTSATQPPATVLYQNFPNPFPMGPGEEHRTRIWFDLDRPTRVRLAIYDLRGRLVRRLIPASTACGDDVFMNPGLYGRDDSPVATGCILTYWDGIDDLGRRVPRGVYVLRLTTDMGHQSRPLVYMPDD